MTAQTKRGPKKRKKRSPHEVRPTCVCTGRSGEEKTKFISRRSAISTAIARGWPPRAYRCPNSDSWHLTH